MVFTMRAHLLSKVMMKRPKFVQVWVKNAQVDIIGISENKHKVALVKSWVGRELLNLFE